jgi:hypothetical protein
MPTLIAAFRSNGHRTTEPLNPSSAQRGSGHHSIHIDNRDTDFDESCKRRPVALEPPQEQSPVIYTVSEASWVVTQ